MGQDYLLPATTYPISAGKEALSSSTMIQHRTQMTNVMETIRHLRKMPDPGRI